MLVAVLLKEASMLWRAHTSIFEITRSRKASSFAMVSSTSSSVERFTKMVKQGAATFCRMKQWHVSTESHISFKARNEGERNELIWEGGIAQA